MKRDSAKSFIDMALGYERRLLHVLQRIKDQEDEQEFKVLRSAVAQVMGDMDYEVVRHMMREHPDLEPEEWKPDRVGVPPIPNPIATRELWTIDPDGQRRPVTVLLAAPVNAPPAIGGYECAFQILGTGNELVQKRFGSDTMKAMIWALTTISSQLQEQRRNGRKLWWRDESNPDDDLGFPPPKKTA